MKATAYPRNGTWRALPRPILRRTEQMRPIPIPWAMLKVSGIAKIVRTAGAAVSNSDMSISTTDCIMNIPTMTRPGAVAQGGGAGGGGGGGGGAEGRAPPE